MKGRLARSCMPPATGAVRSARLPGDGPPPRHPTKSVLLDDAPLHFGALEHFAGLDSPMSATTAGMPLCTSALGAGPAGITT